MEGIVEEEERHSRAFVGSASAKAAFCATGGADCSAGDVFACVALQRRNVPVARHASWDNL